MMQIILENIKHCRFWMLAVEFWNPRREVRLDVGTNRWGTRWWGNCKRGMLISPYKVFHSPSCLHLLYRVWIKQLCIWTTWVVRYFLILVFNIAHYITLLAAWNWKYFLYLLNPDAYSYLFFIRLLTLWQILSEVEGLVVFALKFYLVENYLEVRLWITMRVIKRFCNI